MIPSKVNEWNKKCNDDIDRDNLNPLLCLPSYAGDITDDTTNVFTMHFNPNEIVS